MNTLHSIPREKPKAILEDFEKLAILGFTQGYNGYNTFEWRISKERDRDHDHGRLQFRHRGDVFWTYIYHPNDWLREARRARLGLGDFDRLFPDGIPMEE